MISPGYPQEMAFFTRGLAAVGATVIGVGDQPRDALPAPAREALAHYEHVSLADEGAVSAALQGLSRHVRIDQVECLWEPYMILAARLREAFGLRGMTVQQTLPFRDKELMKRTLDAAGIRTPDPVTALIETRDEPKRNVKKHGNGEQRRPRLDQLSLQRRNLDKKRRENERDGGC